MTAAEPIRVLIVDDEPPARRTLADLVAADPETVAVGECGSGPEAVEAIRRLRPDLVFLDVQMPELDGFGVLAALGALEGGALPLVVFVTAYDRYAVQAFEVHALDYLLKPFDDERFAAALGRAKEAIRRREVEAVGRRLAALLADRREGRDEGGAGSSAEAAGTAGGGTGIAAAPAGAGPDYLQRLLISTAGRVILVPVEEIDWIEAADYYVRVHAGPARHLHRESLSTLEERLDPASFARVHRSAIVNLDRVRELRPLFKGNCRVVLADGTELPLSRHRRTRIEEALRGV